MWKLTRQQQDAFSWQPRLHAIYDTIEGQTKKLWGSKVCAHQRGGFDSIVSAANARLEALEAWQVVALTVLSMLVIQQLLYMLRGVGQFFQEKGKCLTTPSPT